MSISKLGIGIAGLGLIARSHAMGYMKLVDVAEIRGVCDADPSRATAFANEFGGKPSVTLGDLIDDPSIDAIDLILPHHLHYEAAMAVLDAGKHLLIEKPLAPTYRESLDICRKAQEAGVRFMVAENTRYVRGYVVAERIIREGVIGTINGARTYLSSNEKTRLQQPDFWGRRYSSGGGLIADSGPHSFYLLKWLLGDFQEVCASATQVFPLGAEVEDTVEVTGTLVNGTHYICGFSSVSEIPHSERLELYGTEGGIIIDQMANPVVKVFRGYLDFAGWAVDEVPFGPDGWHPGGWHYESVLEEVADFVGSILENRPPTINSNDCAYSIGVVEAAYRSLRARAPVEVSFS
jgi:predicted dehydrogenase